MEKNCENEDKMKEKNEDKVLKALGWLRIFATEPEYSNCEIYMGNKNKVYINGEKFGIGKRYGRKLTKKELKKIREKLDEAAKAENVKSQKIGDETNVTTLYTKNFCTVEYVTEGENMPILEIRRNESHLI